MTDEAVHSDSGQAVEATATVASAEHAPAAPSLLKEDATWIGLAFLITVVLIVKYLMPMINKGLDGRADKIRDQLEQAKRLRAEAQELLKTYQSEQAAKLKEAEEILATAKQDAAHLRAHAAEELKQALARRTQQAKEKIARAEAEAVTQVRREIVETASRMAHEMLTVHMGGKGEDPTISRAVTAIERSFN